MVCRNGRETDKHIISLHQLIQNLNYHYHSKIVVFNFEILDWGSVQECKQIDSYNSIKRKSWIIQCGYIFISVVTFNSKVMNNLELIW